MPQNFYHGKQADIVAGSANFASLIATGFATYGLTSAQSTAFQTLNTALQSAYTAATEPTTRTPVSIEAKDTAITNMRTSALLLSKIVYATATVTDAQLVALGLLPRPARTPRPPMTTPPVVTVRSVVGRLVTVRIEAAAPADPTDPLQYKYQGLATRGTAEIQFPNDVASGATAWIAAAWMSRRGAPGVACTPVQVTIQGGPVLAAAA